MLSILTLPLSLYADDSKNVEDFPMLGGLEFEQSCAVCHGFKGKGNGVMADSLKTKPSDLTVLTKNNHGHFPFTRVFRVIEGSPRVGVHGSREMPVWGDRYRKESEMYDADAYVYTRGLILELLTYIMTIQEE
jgi:mono/diheme cytochrome c family protein